MRNVKPLISLKQLIKEVFKVVFQNVSITFVISILKVDTGANFDITYFFCCLKILFPNKFSCP